MNNGRRPFGAGNNGSRRDFVVAAALATSGGIWWLSGRSAPRGAASLEAASLGAARDAAARGPAPEVSIADFAPNGTRTGVRSLRKVIKTDAHWRRQLSELEFDVLRKFDDEVPFTGAYWNNHVAGIYRCAACDTAVFGSADKFDSGTGWPSFTKPLAKENIVVGRHGALATAITCARCDSFLGDLFDDGPKPTGLRHCINSASLRFVAANTPRTGTAVFAGGCFWGVDAVYKHVIGVREVVSGYAGGKAATADYETVSSGTTGHAESVRVTYDPAVVSYETLLKVFFLVAHDPTQLNRQGPDEGTQYRSSVFYADDAQRKAAESAAESLGRRKVFDSKIVTAIVALDRFYPAEDYHQNYLALHLNSPYIMYNDLPKLSRLQAELPEWYRDSVASR